MKKGSSLLFFWGGELQNDGSFEEKWNWIERKSFRKKNWAGCFFLMVDLMSKKWIRFGKKTRSITTLKKKNE